jgi:hypothetical protein
MGLLSLSHQGVNKVLCYGPSFRYFFKFLVLRRVEVCEKVVKV